MNNILKRLNRMVDIVTPDISDNVWYAGLLFWFPILIFTALARGIVEEGTLLFDIEVLTFLHDSANSFLDRLSLFITQFGAAIFIVPATLSLVGWLYYKRRNYAAARMFLIVCGAGLMNMMLKLVFQRNRPSLWEVIVTEKSYSFPSGHAMASSAFAFAIIALAWHTKWRWAVFSLGIVFVLAVGFTRVYLGVHFPSDIIAGWCASLLWALVVCKFIPRRTTE